eukprot:3447726-Heterocapsa_arctica.AAC.1
MASIEDARFRNIHQVLGTPIVCLQATRRKFHDQPCSVKSIFGYTIYQFGYGPKSSSHAVCSIALKSKLFPSHSVVK